MLGRRKRREIPEPTEVRENPYTGLRAMALDAVARGLPLPGPEHPEVSGVVVDVPAQGGVATIVALTDGATSMYTSTGGGTIGAGEHAQVAEATQRLLEAIQRSLGFFEGRGDGELPPSGMVRFHVLTPSATRVLDVPEDAFWGRSPHEAMPVIAGTQDVISAISAVSPG